jgi:hypothetical protein
MLHLWLFEALVQVPPDLEEHLTVPGQVQRAPEIQAIPSLWNQVQLFEGEHWLVTNMHMGWILTWLSANSQRPAIRDSVAQFMDVRSSVRSEQSAEPDMDPSIRLGLLVREIATASKRGVVLHTDHRFPYLVAAPAVVHTFPLVN